MAYLGSVPAGQFLITAAADPSDINASGGAVVELEDSLLSGATGIEIISTLPAPAVLYRGPNSDLEALMIIPGMTDVATPIIQARQPIVLHAGERLSIRAQANAAIVTGTVIINLWV